MDSLKINFTVSFLCGLALQNESRFVSQQYVKYLPCKKKGFFFERFTCPNSKLCAHYYQPSFVQGYLRSWRRVPRCVCSDVAPGILGFHGCHWFYDTNLAQTNFVAKVSTVYLFSIAPATSENIQSDWLGIFRLQSIVFST